MVRDRNTVSFNIRISRQLRRRINEQARLEQRTAAQIVRRLLERGIAMDTEPSDREVTR